MAGRKTNYYKEQIAINELDEDIDDIIEDEEEVCIDNESELVLGNDNWEGIEEFGDFE